MTMQDWAKKLDAFLQFNDAEILKDKGKVTAAIAKAFAESEFEKYRVIQMCIRDRAQIHRAPVVQAPIMICCAASTRTVTIKLLHTGLWMP